MRFIQLSAASRDIVDIDDIEVERNDLRPKTTLIYDSAPTIQQRACEGVNNFISLIIAFIALLLLQIYSQQKNNEIISQMLNFAVSID